jgi:histidinol-phosphate aminotransferase
MAKTRRGAPFARIVREIPATVPFLAPEAIERRSGKALTLRLGANESAFGPSPKALEAMRQAAAQVNWYGDPESYELRAALAERHGVGMESIVVGCGVDDLLELIVRTYLEPGATAVTSLGGYPTFAYHVTGYGGRLERIPYRDDRNDLAGLAEAAGRSRARIVYLANPDNPSGSWVTAEEIAALVKALPEDCLLLLDEAYSDFAPVEALPLIDVSDRRVIRARTFSKAHGMAGARIGYALATAEIVAAFDKIRLHFGVNRIAQAGALASLQDSEHLESVVAAVTEGRAEYTALAHAVGVAPLPSTTNFVTMDVGGVERAKALVAALAERGVFIRMPGAPPLDRCVRVTVGTPKERAAFAEILREIWPQVAEAHPVAV